MDRRRRPNTRRRRRQSDENNDSRSSEDEENTTQRSTRASTNSKDENIQVEKDETDEKEGEEENDDTGDGDEDQQEEQEAEEDDDIEENENIDERIAELEKISDSILNGTHAEFEMKNKVFEQEKIRELKTAELHRTLQMKNTQDLYNFSIQRAHNLYENTKVEIKDDIISQTKKTIEALKSQVKDLELAERNKKRKSVDLEPINMDTSKESDNSSIAVKIENYRVKVVKAREECKRVFNLEALSTPLLTPEEVMNDMKEIYLDWKEICKKKEEKNEELHVLHKRGKLEYVKDIYVPGDEVIVHSKFSKEDYSGILSSITDNALYILLEGGTKVRVYLSTLRNKRCFLLPRTFGERGLKSVESTGWAYCELYDSIKQ